MKSFVAYHGERSIKDKYIARVEAHRSADELVRGATGENGKGCAVWCTLNRYNHMAYETELGIPQSLARIEDGIFEGMPLYESMNWPRQFLAAIKPGSDLSPVTDRFLYWLLADPIDGVIRFANTLQTCEVIERVIGLYKSKIAGQSTAWQDWNDAAYAASAVAYTASASDAACAASRAASDAADAAADAAARAASRAADAASSRAAGAAAGAAARSRQAAKLIELLEAA